MSNVNNPMPETICMKYFYHLLLSANFLKWKMPPAKRGLSIFVSRKRFFRAVTNYADAIRSVQLQFVGLLDWAR